MRDCRMSLRSIRASGWFAVRSLRRLDAGAPFRDGIGLRALALLPGQHAGAYAGRGLAWEGKANAEKAKADYRKAVSLAQKYDDGRCPGYSRTRSIEARAQSPIGPTSDINPVNTGHSESAPI
jgi:hypothetical protein